MVITKQFDFVCYDYSFGKGGLNSLNMISSSVFWFLKTFKWFLTLDLFDSLVFVDSVRKIHQLHQDSSAATDIESASKAVLMMIFSPSRCLAAKTAVILSEILSNNGEGYIKNLVHILKSVTMSGSVGYSDTLQVAISLIGLACFSGLS